MFSIYIDMREDCKSKMPTRLSVNAKKDNSSEEPFKYSKPDLNQEISSHNNSDSTFEKLESLCNDPNISLTEIKGIAKTFEIKQDIDTKISNKKKILQTMNEKLKIAPAIEEDLFNDNSIDLFVKLSDLDKPTSKSEYLDTQQNVAEVRMTKSIPEINKLGQSRYTLRFHPDTYVSLNRLFPNFKTMISESLSHSTTSQSNNIDMQVSDITEDYTTQMSSLIGYVESCFGQDLLKIFLEEMGTDVIIETTDRKIKAHTFILRSRCQFFARLLSGSGMERAGNVIVIPEYSASVVHFVLCHIYSGVTFIPDFVEIEDVIGLSQLFGLDALIEPGLSALKTRKCHDFHEPCDECIDGVLHCLSWSATVNMDELHQNCLDWITKYHYKVWATTEFISLDKDLREKCYLQHIDNMCIEYFVKTVYGCGIITSALRNREYWIVTTEVMRLCQRLIDAYADFAATQLVAMLKLFSCTPFDEYPIAHNTVSKCFISAIERAPSGEVCRAYAFLSDHINLFTNSQNQSKLDVVPYLQPKYSSTYVHYSLLNKHACDWRLQCEFAIISCAPRSFFTQAFKDLPLVLQKSLQEVQSDMRGTQANGDVASTSTSQSMDIERGRACFVPCPSKSMAAMSIEFPNNICSKSPTSMSQTMEKHRGIACLVSRPPVKAVKSVKANNVYKDDLPKVRTTKAQEQRTKFNLNKKNTFEDQIYDNATKKTRGKAYINTKSRYLLPRVYREDNSKVTSRKLMTKMVSSSESSPNSSPIQIRYLRCCWAPQTKGPCTLSQDSLATTSRPRSGEPSTDSLSESNNYNMKAACLTEKHTAASWTSEANKLRLQPTPCASTSNYKKSRIPVYQKMKYKSEVGHVPDPEHRIKTSSVSTSDIQYRVNERKVDSFTSTKKSSSSKMVPKKELAPNRANTKPVKSTAKHLKQDESSTSRSIPVMQRSATFSKDEPAFGDKTTNLNIDQ